MVRDAVFRKTCSQGYFSKQSMVSIPTKCKYLHHNDGYLKIGPFKVEIAREVPYVSILHDILNDKEINWLIEKSSPDLSHSRDLRQYENDPKLDGSPKIVQKILLMQCINNTF